MSNSYIIKIILIILSLAVFLIVYLNKIKEKTSIDDNKILQDNNTPYNSNIILDVKYSSKDNNGNNYKINAKKGEIDLKNPSIIFLTDVYAIIEMNNSEIIEISSYFGKYNIDNYNTIFSKNVSVDYIDHNIKSEYLYFSIIDNLMSISKNVIYKNSTNILFADVIEMNIQTKDTKIFMNENNKKVKIINKN